jgi:CRP/FNR family transcriptional regulator, anaerobic regulatory protein
LLQLPVRLRWIGIKLSIPQDNPQFQTTAGLFIYSPFCGEFQAPNFFKGTLRGALFSSIMGTMTTILQAPYIISLQENLPFWNKISDTERETLLKGTLHFFHTKGVLVHDDRNKCTGLLMVVTGQLRVFIISETGKEITLYRLFDRDICILSASCLIKNITFDVHVQAEKDTTMLRIATDSYQKVSNVNPLVQEFTNQLVSSRFSDVMWVVEQVVFMSFDRRLAMHLLEQAAMAENDSFSITHDSIARDLGTAREVVTRMLSRFQDEGLVSLVRGGITLKDREGLYRLT